MKLIQAFLLINLIAFLFYSCSSSSELTNIGATRSIDTLEEELKQNNQTVPTLKQYQEVRESFLGSMEDLLNDLEQQAGSNTAKIKNIVAFAGITIALAGTIAGFFVTDENTRATLLQASATVAVVSGVLGLLPIGSQPKGSESIRKYLKVQIPTFKTRWPANPETLPNQIEWEQFVLDTKQIEEIVETLGE